jgi:FAD/FMN-containing dehydrogenase
VMDRARLRDPFERDCGCYLLAQFGSERDVLPELAEAVAAMAPEPQVTVASDTEGRRRLWAYREDLSEAIRATGVPIKLDVAVPLVALAEFSSQVTVALADAFPGVATYLFGHLGDGNVHVNVVGPSPADEKVDELVLRLVADLGGTVSAEHGIGIAKRRFLHLCRSPSEIEMMVAIKSSLDPDGIMGFGRVV